MVIFRDELQGKIVQLKIYVLIFFEFVKFGCFTQLAYFFTKYIFIFHV